MSPPPRPSDPARPERGSRPSSARRSAPPKGGSAGAKGKGRPDGRSAGGGAGRASGRGGPADDDRAPKQWGSLARKGARRLGEDTRGAGNAPVDRGPRTPGQSEEWIDEGPVRGAAKGAVRRGGAGGRGARRSDSRSQVDVEGADVARAVGPKDAARFESRLREAARAFEAERYQEARKLLMPLAERMPGNAAVRELLGLTHYRLGRWKLAIGELEALHQMSGTAEQHPVLADCYRALRQWDRVEELWNELREVSPSAELVTEGRIVMAGSLADRSRLPEAIELLEKGFRFPKNPQPHHLRRAYALADLRERAGDLPQARSLFERIESVAPDFGDIGDRSRALR